MKLLQALINRIRGFLNLSAKKISDPVIDSQFGYRGFQRLFGRIAI